MSQGVKYGLIAAVAAAVAIIVGLVLLIDDGDEGGIDTIDQPEGASTSTTPPGPTGDRRLELGSFGLDPSSPEWSAELFAPGATFGGELAAIGITDTERFRIWRTLILSNPSHSEPDCVATGETDGELEATCVEQYKTLDNLAIGVDAVNTLTSKLRIGSDGIREVTQTTVWPEGTGDVGPAFEQWIGFSHPGETAYDDLFAASTMEELESALERNRERTEEWRSHNARYGCTLENWKTCGPAAVALQLVRHWQLHEVEELAALFDDGATFDGSLRSAGDLESRVQYERAIGLTLGLPSCTPDASSTDDGDVTIACEGTIVTAASRALDTPALPAPVFEFQVSDESRIVAFTRSLDPDGLVAVNASFILWLEGSHPDDVATMIDADGNPITTPEAIELWATYTEEFVAAQG